MNSKYIWGTRGFRFITDAACHRLSNFPLDHCIYDLDYGRVIQDDLQRFAVQAHLKRSRKWLFMNLIRMIIKYRWVSVYDFFFFSLVTQFSLVNRARAYQAKDTSTILATRIDMTYEALAKKTYQVRIWTYKKTKNIILGICDFLQISLKNYKKIPRYAILTN